MTPEERAIRFKVYKDSARKELIETIIRLTDENRNLRLWTLDDYVADMIKRYIEAYK